MLISQFILSVLLTFRIMSFSNIYAINAWLLLAPSSLCCDWSLGSVPLVTSFVDVRNIWSMTLYIGLVILVLHVFKSKRYAVCLLHTYVFYIVHNSVVYGCISYSSTCIMQESFPSWHGTCLVAAPIYTRIWSSLQSRLRNC